MVEGKLLTEKKPVMVKLEPKELPVFVNNAHLEKVMMMIGLQSKFHRSPQPKN